MPQSFLARGSELFGLALCLTVSACNSNRCPDGSEDRGFFSDVPPPTLCRTDILEFSPKTAILTLTRNGNGTAAQGGTAGMPPPAGASGAGESQEPGAAENALTMAVLTMDENRRPLDTVNVDISVCSGEGLIELVPSGNGCMQVTATRLQCHTTSAGVAQFEVRGLRGGGSAAVCASSGRHASATATLEVRGEDAARLDLDVDNSATYGESASLACAAVPCQSGVRRVAAYLNGLDAAGNPAAVVLSRPALLEVDTLAGSGAFLSQDAECTPRSIGSFHVTLPTSGRSRPFYVCAGSQAADIELVASLAGFSTVRERVTFPAVPVHVRLTEAGGTGAGGAPAETSVRLDVRDCNGNPLPGLSVAIAAEGESATAVTTDALGGAQLETLAESLTIGIADPATGRVSSTECSLREAR